MARPSELEPEATGPLKGVRICDLTSVVFGAYATQLLGDLGAEVIAHGAADPVVVGLNEIHLFCAGGANELHRAQLSAAALVIGVV